MKRSRQEEEASGGLLPRDEVEAVVAQALQKIRRGLGNIPRLFAPRLPKNLQTTLAEELRRLIDQVLTGLVVELKKAGDDEEKQEDRPKPRPKAKPQGKDDVADQAQAD